MHGGDEALAGPAAAHVGVAGRQELLPGHRAEQPAERAGEQQRPGPRVDALPGHVTNATSSILPSLNDTTKSPPNEAPPAGLSTSDDPQPSPSSGSLPWARMRSRSSSSILSPRRPWTPSFSLVRASTSAHTARSRMVAVIPA